VAHDNAYLRQSAGREKVLRTLDTGIIAGPTAAPGGTRRFPWKARVRIHASGIAAAVVMATLASATPAAALKIELKDVAPDRIERQIAAVVGALPLPDTPDTANFDKRLADKGLEVGMPVFIRAFKAESELEIWLKKEDRFVLFSTYPICQWSGSLGPKLLSGDKQTPEGFYTVTRRQLHRSARHPRALNLGFPNTYDKVLDRTGNYILVHGGCSSVGCYAMTDAVVDEIFKLTRAAIRKGQRHVPVHSFPFRMTDANLAKHREHAWHAFWQNLKQGYDAFEATGLPPRVSICDGAYAFQSADPAQVHKASLKNARRSSSRYAGPGAITRACPKVPDSTVVAPDANSNDEAAADGVGGQRAGREPVEIPTRRQRTTAGAPASANAPPGAG